MDGGLLQRDGASSPLAEQEQALADQAELTELLMEPEKKKQRIAPPAEGELDEEAEAIVEIMNEADYLGDPVRGLKRAMRFRASRLCGSQARKTQVPWDEVVATPEMMKAFSREHALIILQQEVATSVGRIHMQTLLNQQQTADDINN